MKKICVQDISKNNFKVFLNKSTLLKEVNIHGTNNAIYIAPIIGNKINFKKTNEEYGKSDVFENVQLIPGISNPNENPGELYIRGGDSGQNLILYDGIKLYQTSFLYGAISIFNPFNIDNIKIYKGNTNVAYGNHISGVIDIETRKEPPKKTKFNIGADMLQHHTSLEIPISKKLGIILTTKKNLGIETPTYNQTYNRIIQNSIIASPRFKSDSINNNVDLSFFNISSKIIYTPNNRNTFTLSALMFRNFADVFLEEKSDTLDSSRTYNYYYSKYHAKNRNLGYSLLWNNQLSKKIKVNTNLYFSYYRQNILEKFKFISTNNAEILNNTINTNKINNVGIKTSIEVKNEDDSQVTSGYEYTKQMVRYNYSSSNDDEDINQKESNETHSLFTNYVLKKNSITLNFGLRINYNSLYKKFFFSPRFFLQKKLYPNLYIKSGLEFKQQNLNRIIFTDNNLNLNTYNQWILSKKYPSMTSEQFYGGFFYKKPTFLVDIEYYRKSISGVLYPIYRTTTKGDPTLLQGNSLVSGLDILIKKRFSSSYNSTLGYSWGNAKFEFDHINDGHPFPTDFDITNNVNWTHTFTYKKINFNFSWLFNTGLINSIIAHDNSTPTPNLQISYKRAPNYNRFDFSVNHSFQLRKKIHGRIGLSIKNLLDNKVLMRDVRTTKSETQPSSLKIYNQRFTPNVSFELTFM